MRVTFFMLEKRFSLCVSLRGLVHLKLVTEYSFLMQKEANEKQLAALKSVVKCLEDHKLDATELASLKIHEKIAKCEKELSKAKIKLHSKNVKRKFEDVDPPKVQDSQAKQLWPSAEAPRFPDPQSIRQSQEQGIGSISDYRYAYSGYTMPVSSEASHGTPLHPIKQTFRDVFFLIPDSSSMI